MNKYKNISWSAILYVISIVWLLVIAKPNLYSFSFLMIVSALLALAGVFMGLKSIKAKELVLISYLDVIVGLILVIIPIGIFLLERSPI